MVQSFSLSVRRCLLVPRPIRGRPKFNYDADISSREDGGVVDTIADHRDQLPLLPESPLPSRFSPRVALRRNTLLVLARSAGMSTTVEVPDADETCAYCGSRIFDHDPICVRDCNDDCGLPTYFCNYACLSTYVDENGLSTGNACEWSPDESDCC